MRFFDLVGFVLGADGRHDGVAGGFEVSAVEGVRGGLAGTHPCSRSRSRTCAAMKPLPPVTMSVLVRHSSSQLARVPSRTGKKNPHIDQDRSDVKYLIRIALFCFLEDQLLAEIGLQNEQ